MRTELLCAGLFVALTGCSRAAAHDAGHDDDVSGADATADASDVTSPCGNACPMPLVCRERDAGEFGCEPLPDGGACPAGWHLCSDRCVMEQNPCG